VVTVPHSDLAPVRDAWTVLHVITPWLPLVVLVLAVAAVVLAPQRSWMLLAEAGAVLVGTAAVALAATGARSWYVGHAQQSSSIAAAIGDALGDSIGHWLRDVSIGALCVAVGAFVCLWFREVQLGRSAQQPAV
jgi:hypothetical protein